MGSTWSGPLAYLQKHGWPMMGMPGGNHVKWIFRWKTLLAIKEAVVKLLGVGGGNDFGVKILEQWTI